MTKDGRTAKKTKDKTDLLLLLATNGAGTLLATF